WTGETRRIPGEQAVALLVMNVQIQHVKRQVVLSILAHYFFRYSLRVIAPAALLIAQRPHRRQRHVTGQLPVAAQNLFHRGPPEEVVVHLAAFGRKRGVLLSRLAEIEVRAVAIVEKDSISLSALPAYV